MGIFTTGEKVLECPGTRWNLTQQSWNGPWSVRLIPGCSAKYIYIYISISMFWFLGVFFCFGGGVFGRATQHVRS